MSSHEIHVIILNVIIFITTEIELCLGTSAGRKETQSYRILLMAWLFNAFRWHINHCLSSVPVIRKEPFEYVLHKGQYMAWFYSTKGEKLRFFHFRMTGPNYIWLLLKNKNNFKNIVWLSSMPKPGRVTSNYQTHLFQSVERRKKNK